MGNIHLIMNNWCGLVKINNVYKMFILFISVYFALSDNRDLFQSVGKVSVGVGIVTACADVTMVTSVTSLAR